VSVAAAFDTAAATYDASFTDTHLGRWLREQVWDVLRRVFPSGSRVLEIGCGTGEDAVWLARRGVAVVATEVSLAMLAVAQAKAQSAGVAVSFDAPQGVFDGALANFGVVNCIVDRRSFGKTLADRVRPGGKVVLVVMGPLCGWEVVWHVAHLQPGAAFRRLRRDVLANVPGGGRQAVWYPTPRRLRRELEPCFEHVQTRAVGVVLPPSYLARLVNGWPKWVGALDRMVGALPGAGWLGDHYLSVFERR
jgi:2-polyprenyl-3-methyl-5-hydroxy-6-metoxy-1,4-benzoquinol methylase